MKPEIYFDGTNWVHISKDFCLISKIVISEFDFEKECTRHIPLFTKSYYPKTGDVVFDVGSWNGAELPVWSRAVGDSGHVYAIEAVPEFYEQSLKVVETLGLKNVTCINAAVMDKPGVVEIGILSDTGIDSTIHGQDSEKKISVPATTLDQIINDYEISQVDYLKMNIEGAEEFAIQGIEDFSKVKNWCISTHDFCGIPTKEFVTNFLKGKNLNVEIHRDMPGLKWVGGYLYATNKSLD